jgi:hypothetical protein
MTPACTAVGDNARTFTHIKGCPVCREAWPMITAVLDGMTTQEIQGASTMDIVERGLVENGTTPE